MGKRRNCRSILTGIALVALASGARGLPESSIDRPTLDAWAAPYRGWHYHPEHVIPAEPGIKGFEKFKSTDVPTVFQLPGDDTWYMTFIGFDGRGYNSFIAESTDLIHWENLQLAMGFGPEGDFDHGGRVLGAFLYESYDLKAPRVLKRYEGKYWSLYGAYPRQGGYELRPGYEGLACSEDGRTWTRARRKPILSVHQPDCGQWEKDCVYQPWLVEHRGGFYDFYNAANGSIEQTGLAFSRDLFEWRRYEGNPILRNTPGGYDERFCSDPKVFRDGDHWTMLYFGVGRGGAHIMAAFSRDLLHWSKHPEPLYKAGGHPRGLDKTYAHKISLVFHPENKTFYMFYCAVGNKGRGIGLITSKQPEPSASSTVDLQAIPSPVILRHTKDSHYRDPAAVYHDGWFRLFFTVNQVRQGGKTMVSFLGTTRSRNLVDWGEVKLLTPEDRKLNYSSPGNVIRYGGKWIICFQTYPTLHGGFVGDGTARLFTMRSRDLETWSKPELLPVKGPGVPVEEMGRMIDPYLLEDKDEPGKWWCFYKQRGMSMSWTRDFKTWTYRGNTRCGENVTVLVKEGRYIVMHSPGRDGMGLLVSEDLQTFRPYTPGTIKLGYGRWPWAMMRLTAGTVLDLTGDPRVGRYLMFYHTTAGGPHEHVGGCSLGIAWSDDLTTWDWPGKAGDLERWSRSPR